MDVDGWQHQLAEEVFEERMAGWGRRWEEADRIFECLPPETRQRIIETTTTDVNEALDVFISDMAIRIHPEVRAYMMAVSPYATDRQSHLLEEVARLRAEVSRLSARLSAGSS